jgi:hypothetical protein
MSALADSTTSQEEEGEEAARIQFLSFPSELKSNAPLLLSLPRPWKSLTWRERLSAISSGPTLDGLVAQRKMWRAEEERTSKAAEERRALEHAVARALEREKGPTLEEEATTALAQVQSGQHFAIAFGGIPHTYPKLMRQCVKQHDQFEERSRGIREQLERFVLHHPLFGEDVLIEAFNGNQMEDRHGGAGGGSCQCRLISQAEAAALPPLSSLSRLPK